MLAAALSSGETVKFRHSVATPLLLLTCGLLLTSCTPSINAGQPLSADPFLGSGQVREGEAQQSQANATQPDSAESGLNHNSPAPTTPKLRYASGTLNILVDDEAAIPQALIDDFTDLTGVQVVTSIFNPQSGAVPVDIFLGFDSHAIDKAHKAQLLASQAPNDTRATTPIAQIPAAVDYARDDVCVLADRQWYVLNGAQIPTALAPLAEANEAGKMVQAPEDSDTAIAFSEFLSSTLKDKAGVWQAKLVSAAPFPATWDEAAATHTVRLYEEPATAPVPGRQLWAGGASGPMPATAIPSDEASRGERPLRIAPVSLLGRAVTNTGTQSYLTPVAGTCAPRRLYVAASAAVNNEDAVEAFIEYMTSGQAQRILAQTGAALPLDQQNGVSTLFEQVITQ